MTREDIFNAELSEKYQALAEGEVLEYLTLCDVPKMKSVEKRKHIDKVYQFTAKFLVIDDSHVTPESITKVISKLSTSFEEHNLQMKLLNLLLSIIEKTTGLKSGPLPAIVQLRQEQPTLTPDRLLNSQLYQAMYDLLEDRNACYEYLVNPGGNRGFLVMWLVLKEGIRYLSDVVKIIDNQDAIYTIDQHWFFESKDKRFWLSTKAELLLSAYFREQRPKIKSKVMSEVNQLLHENRIIPVLEQIKFSVLSDALRSEFTLSFSSLEFGLSSYIHKSTHLKKHSLYRLITGIPIEVKTLNSSELITTVRQKRAWTSSFALSSGALRNRPESEIKELTVREQLKLIDKFTKRMTALGLKERKTTTTVLRDELREFLENSEQSKSYPWCWLVLGWMYQLLDKGGKVKSRLKLNTIRSYIDYVAKPFITEFSGCEPSLLDSLDWAEKLNIAAEQIQAPTKKSYLLYFAEYLIESEIAVGLCLSDIDIPAVGATVNANLLTLEEADEVVAELQRYGAVLGKLAQIVLCLGFYGGLRRGEISGLQYKDFHFNDDLSYFNLHIRPNRYRELKSSDSSRNLPLDVLMPKDVCIQLRDYLDKHKIKFKRFDSLIFDDRAILNQAFDIITVAMQRVTGDASLRFHHCRHSFCNWNWIRIHHANDAQITPFRFLQHDYFSEGTCKQLSDRLAITSYSRKRMWLLASLLGHASPTTTISSYLHIGDWIRRACFANHCATDFELRAFWGQRIKVDEWRRAGIKSTITQLRKNVTPATLCYPIYTIPHLELVQSENRLQEQVEKDVSLTLLWRIIRRLGEGFSVSEVSEGLNVRALLVEQVIEKDQTCMALAYAQSKYTLNPLVNYHKLDSGNIDSVQNLIHRYEKAKMTQDFSKLDLTLIPRIVEALVGAKDGLIRTNDNKAALTLIRLLKLLKIPEENLRIKWYFPSGHSFVGKQLQTYRTHYKYWQDAISKNCGYTNLKVECIAPHTLRGQLPQSNSEITWSDDGRFLNYNPPGYITIHVLRKRFKNVRYDEHCQVMNTPQRTKALISFIRLLCIKSLLQS
ncbi:hypothetical protein BIY22_03730 [Vibrio panuliri]|uniref:Tyr recombinase domain-containing protein n=1 Tax=Vibrio panuliri TaxID=1381081 RepID=A0A1Q9HIG6_9VIBR|nr:tyrosine-type recombinase/integrase [Vibrio panuliri]OLQ90125.1 hypothetical protein BIY22_03730 [Vibrio panuliri]